MKNVGATKKKQEAVKAQEGDFTAELIAQLNKDHGTRVAYNLSSDISPTHVSRWISTGSRQLDMIVSNKEGGGLPEGRIIEIFGPPSIGKSHIATQIAKNTQALGGIVVYIDTENATNVENLAALGVDVSKRFVYVDTHCTEEVLDIAEKTIMKARAMQKDIPITIIWDSVAATSPKAELNGEYDKDTIGLQARVISKGMRKINGVIANQKVLFVCLNQIRVKIGCVGPDTLITVRDPTNTIHEMKISNFFSHAGFKVSEMEYNRFYEIDGWQISSFDMNEQKNIWKNVTHIVRKEPSVPVVTSVGETKIFVSPEHQYYCKKKNSLPAWIDAVDLVNEKEVFLFSSAGTWDHAALEAGNEEVEILDMSVSETESYFSQGYLSHNTMYGDPTTVPGGNAIPFHASVRIKLGAGSQIKGSDGEQIIGINVSAKTIKNKVASPFRTANFQIHFGQGIVEHEEIFDTLRELGPITYNDNEICVEGTGAWKTFYVKDISSGKLIIEKKFTKSKFNDVLDNDNYKEYIDALLRAAYIKTGFKISEADIDVESYEEVRAVSDDLSDEFVSPE